jgi:stress response protein YsnF
LADHDPNPKAAGDGGAQASDETTLRLAEERVVVSKRPTEARVTAVRLSTTETEVPVREELRQERAEVTRVPVDRIVDAPPETRVEDGVTIVPVVEEVMVRRFRVIEELHVAVVSETRAYSETLTLRRQEADIVEVGEG